MSRIDQVNSHNHSDRDTQNPDEAECETKEVFIEEIHPPSIIRVLSIEEYKV